MGDVATTAVMHEAAAVLAKERGVDGAIEQLRECISEVVEAMRSDVILVVLRDRGPCDMKAISAHALAVGTKIHSSSAQPILEAMIQRGEVEAAEEAGTNGRKRTVYRLAVPS